MEYYSLLGSYIHVVYENKKQFRKNFFEKYFFERWKFWNLKIFGNFDFFQKSLSKSDLIYLRIFEIFRNFRNFLDFKILIGRKIFFEQVFFRNFFYFRKLHGYSYLTSYWTPSNSFWSQSYSREKITEKKNLLIWPNLI